jgi:tetratricopeptide (TPR) repeat protein
LPDAAPIGRAAIFVAGAVAWTLLSSGSRALADTPAPIRAPETRIDALDRRNAEGMDLEAAGRSGEARTAYDEALAGFREIADLEGQVIVLGNLGALDESLGDYGGALARFEEAEAIARRAGSSPWAARRAAIARVNQATALEKVGDYGGAFERVRADLEDPSALEPAERVALWTNAGVLLRNLGDPRHALDLFDRAWDEALRSADAATQANVRLNRGLAHWLDLGDPPAARAEIEAAAGLARASGDHAEIVQTLFYRGRFELARGEGGDARATFEEALAEATESGNAEGKWSALEGLGRVALERRDFAAAEEHFRAAANEIERARDRLTDRRRRAGYFGDRRGVYEGWATARLAASPADTRRVAGALDIAERWRAHDLREIWHDPSPEPTDAAFERPPSLVFFAADGRLLRFALEGNRAEVADRGPADEVANAIRELVGAWSAGQPSETLAARPDRTLAERLLGELPERAAWQVVVDDVLASLPIDALPAADGEPWFERASFALWPSLDALDRGLRATPRAAATTRYVGVGATEAPGLATLPAARREIEAAGARFAPRSRLFLGSEATAQALGHAVDVDLLHVAAHAVRRDGRTELALAPGGDGDARQDGRLDPAAIAQRTLRAGTVLISACRAGADASNARGEALAGLPGAFLAAGAAGVVAPLWDVEDGDAAVFADRWTTRIARGESPHEALRAVKRELRADPRWAPTMRWAPWVAFGAPTTSIPPPGRWFGLPVDALPSIALAALAASAVGLWRGRRRSSRG